MDVHRRKLNSYRLLEEPSVIFFVIVESLSLDSPTTQGSDRAGNLLQTVITQLELIKIIHDCMRTTGIKTKTKQNQKNVKYLKHKTEQEQKLWSTSTMWSQRLSCTRMQPLGCTSRMFNNLTYLSFAIIPTQQLEINQSKTRCKRLVLRWGPLAGTKVQVYCAEWLCCTNAPGLKALQLRSD